MSTKPSPTDKGTMNGSALPRPVNKSQHFLKCNGVKLANQKSVEWAKTILKGCSKEICIRCALDADVNLRNVFIYDGELDKCREENSKLTAEVAQCRRQKSELRTKFTQLEAMRHREEQRASDVLRERNNLEAKFGELEAKVEKMSSIIGQQNNRILEMALRFKAFPGP